MVRQEPAIDFSSALQAKLAGLPDLEIDTSRNASIAVHPCFWKALDITPSELEPDFITEIYDDYAVHYNPELDDLRTKQLGRFATQLSDVPQGDKFADKFEEWVLRCVKILFAGSLVNPELHPNGDATQRRDVVATNMAQAGSWHRVLTDYGSRQIVIEAKDYASLKPEDYRQMLSYTSGDYGRFCMIVSRSENDGLTDNERSWVQEMHHEHKRIILIVPAKTLMRCARKMRNTARWDYVEKVLGKILDTYTRSYLALRPKASRVPVRRKGRSRGRRSR